MVTIYRARPVGGYERPDQTETQRLAWLAPQELLRLETHPVLVRLNRAVVENLERGEFVV